MKKVLPIVAVVAFALTAPMISFAADVSSETTTKMERNDDGSSVVEHTSTSEDAAGTERKTESKVETEVDRDGEVEKTVKKKTTVDPKGWFNKKETEEKDTVKKKKGKVKSTHKKEVDGDTVEETETTSPAQ